MAKGNTASTAKRLPTRSAERKRLQAALQEAIQENEILRNRVAELQAIIAEVEGRYYSRSRRARRVWSQGGNSLQERHDSVESPEPAVRVTRKVKISKRRETKKR